MYYFDFVEGKKILKSDFIRNAQAFFTTRELCLCDKSNPQSNEVAANIKLLAKYLDVPSSDFISPIQTHSTNIRLAKKDCFEYLDTDALILTNNSQVVFLNFADCTPIILYDEKQNIGAVIHAGWRGTAGQIAHKTALKLMDEYGSKSDNIVALIGAAICKNCYEVGEDVYLQLKSTLKNSSEVDELWKTTGHVDLQKINEKQLTESGITKIDICPYCTSCNNEYFYSYRKENGTSLRHSAVLKLK